jgi:integrase
MSALAPVLEMPKPKQEPKQRRKRGEGRIFKQTCRDKETGALVEKSPMWWIQYYSHGRQVRESCGSENLAVAERLLRKRLGESAAGVLEPPNAERLKYNELRDALLANYEAKGRKWLRTGKDGKRYISHLTSLNNLFEGYRVKAITPDRIRDFVHGQRAKGLSNASVNRSLALLRRMFSLAIREKKLRVDDAPYFEMLKESKPRQGFLEYNDFLKLRAELPDAIRPVATMGFYTGMRVSEILSLRWTDVSLSDAQAFLGETKNGESRVIPLSHELLEVLKAERQKNPGADFVFTRDGKQIRDFRQVWRNACVKAGLGRFVEAVDSEAEPTYEGLIFHDLRRSGVRNLDRAGVSRTVAMAISGHKTESVYRRYNIVSQRDLQIATAKLESYLSDQNQS